MGNFRHIPKSQWYRDQIIREGGFRCDRCRSEWPMSHLRWQDGAKLCKMRCAFPKGKLDSEMDLARAIEEGAERDIEPLAFPYSSPDVRVAGVTGADTGTTDGVVVLPAGGSSWIIVLSTVGADSSLDTLTYTSGDISDATAPVWASDGTSISINIQADAGATPGDYRLSFNNEELNFVTLKVR